MPHANTNHVQDSDCLLAGGVDPETEDCNICGVSGTPDYHCGSCGGSRFHRYGCPDSDEMLGDRLRYETTPERLDRLAKRHVGIVKARIRLFNVRDPLHSPTFKEALESQARRNARAQALERAALRIAGLVMAESKALRAAAAATVQA